MSRLLLGVTVAMATGACARLNPDWCSKAGRCPAGTTCDPTTNTCVGRHDARRDGPGPIDLRPVEAPIKLDRHSDLPIRCVGGYICAAGAVETCHEAGAASVVRTCPVASCADGHCLIPAGAKACTNDLACAKPPQVWVCTWLLDKGTTPKQVCAQPVPGGEHAAACTTGLDCATGLCTAEGRCYDACDGDTECAPLSCQDAVLNIEGVPKTARSCR